MPEIISETVNYNPFEKKDVNGIVSEPVDYNPFQTISSDGIVSEQVDYDPFKLPELSKPKIQDIPEYQPQPSAYDPTQGELGGTPIESRISPIERVKELGEYAGDVGKGMVYSMAGGVSGVVRAIEEYNNEKIKKLSFGKIEPKTEFGKTAAEFYTKKLEEVSPKKEEGKELQYYAKQIVSNVANNLPHIFVGLASGGQTAALSLMGLQAGGTKYNQLREDEKSTGKALLGSTIVGLSEAATELIPLNKLLKPGLTYAKRVLLYSLTDVPGELINTTIESAVDKVLIKPDMTLKEYGDDLVQTAIISLGSAGVLTGIVHPIVGKGKKQQEPPSPENIKSIVEKAGARYEGIQKAPNMPDTVLFTDLKTGATAHIPIDKFSPEAVQAKLKEIVARKAEFGEAKGTVVSKEEIRKAVEEERLKAAQPVEQDEKIMKILAEAKADAERVKAEKPVSPEVKGIEEKPSELMARKWQVKMAQEPETHKTINKTEIMTWAEKEFNVPLKMKATHKWKAAGTYYPKQQIVRMSKWGELSVVTHEIAHHIDLTILRKQFSKEWRKGKFDFQKELADLDYDQSKRRTSEGFAEYIRHRLTTGEEKTLAPKFDKFFNELFLEKNPKLKKQLNDFKEKLDIWHKQGAENRVIEHIDWGGEHTKVPFLLKVQKSWKFINEKFNDEFYTPQKIVKEIEKITGEKLNPSKNPATMMEYSKSKAGAIARTFVLDKAIDEYGNVKGLGLVDILKPIPNKEMKQFIAYAVSKRAINLNKRGIESGFDIDDSKFLVEKYKDKKWDGTVDELTGWSDHLLEWVLRAGGIDLKTAFKIKVLNPIYLPFKRAFLDEIGVVTGVGGVGGYVDTGVGIKRIKGSGRPIINPIESMIAQSRELIAKSQKIRIARLFIDLAEEEGIGGFISKVPAPMKATTFEASRIKKYLETLTTEKEGLESISEDEYDNMLTVFTQDYKYNGKENIVSVWKDGKQVFYEIHPDLYEAFKGIDTLKLGPVAKILGPFARMLRLGATGLKVSFGLARNPFRDAFSYAIFSKRTTATVFDPIKGIYKDIATKPGEPTWRFKALGGALSGQIGLDRAATMSTYDELLLDKLGKKGKALKIIKHPLTAIRDILSVTEMGPRSVEIESNYKKYLNENKDWSEEDAFVQAFNDAQDVTVNFTKSGKWAKQINEVTAFFNVAIRGPEKDYRSFRESPIQTTVKGIAWLTLLALGSWYKNKDKDWYKNLPRAYRYNNLFFEINDNVYRLPVPFELGTIFMSVPQAVLDYYEGDDKAMGAIIDIAKSQIPDPIPSAFGPLIDVKTNKNYLGVPIESEGMQYLYHTERKKDYTSNFASKMSKGLDKIGVKVSPIQFEYLMDSYSGGFIRQFKLSGERLYDLPVLGDLMLRDPNFPRRQLNEYFLDYEVLGQKKHAGIATPKEKSKLNNIKGFYSYYKKISKNITEAKKNKNYKLLDNYYIALQQKLGQYGYK